MPCGQSENNFILYRLPEEPSSITDSIIMSAQRILDIRLYMVPTCVFAPLIDPHFEPGGPNIYRKIGAGKYLTKTPTPKVYYIKTHSKILIIYRKN